MDKKELKKITTEIYEEFGFVKKGRYYYLDLEDVLICSGFPRAYNSIHLAYNFSIKRFHDESEYQPNNMFDGFESCELRIKIKKDARGYERYEIIAEDYDAETYRSVLREALHSCFDPFKENAMKHIERGYSEIGYLDGNQKFVIHVDKVRALGFKIYEAPKIDIWELWK